MLSSVVIVHELSLFNGVTTVMIYLTVVYPIGAIHVTCYVSAGQLNQEEDLIQL